MMESWEECAIREVKEETNLDITNVKFVHVTNDPMPEEGKHYITIFMSAECTISDAQPENLEPHKCEGWDSFSWHDLRSIWNGERDGLYLFGPLKNMVSQAPEDVLKLLECRRIFKVT